MLWKFTPMIQLSCGTQQTHSAFQRAEQIHRSFAALIPASFPGAGGGGFRALTAGILHRYTAKVRRSGLGNWRWDEDLSFSRCQGAGSCDRILTKQILRTLVLPASFAGKSTS